MLSKRRSKSRRSHENVNVNVNPTPLVTGHSPSPQLSEICVICLMVIGKFQYCKADLPLDDQMVFLKRSLCKHVNNKHTCHLKCFMFWPRSGSSLLILVVPINKSDPSQSHQEDIHLVGWSTSLVLLFCNDLVVLSQKNSLQFLLYSVCSLALSSWWKCIWRAMPVPLPLTKMQLWFLTLNINQNIQI